MCGIAAFVNTGKESNRQFILNAFQNLEYRGYDSCGYLLANYENTLCRKSLEIFKEISNTSWTPTYGLAHTRWADTGAAVLANAHPINVNGIYIVHNGNVDSITEKYEVDVDTEIIGHVLSSEFKTANKFTAPNYVALNLAMQELTGEFAFVAACEHNPVLYFGCNKKRLCLSDDLQMLASDPSVFAGYCDEYYELSSNDGYRFGTIYADAFNIYDHHGNNISSTVLAFKNKKKVYSRQNNTSMLEEIYEQATMQMPQFVDDYPYDNTIVACGSSYNAALSIYTWLYYKGCSIEYATMMRDAYCYSRNYLFISQSGETYDLLRVAEKLPRFNLLTNTPSSHLSELAYYSYDLKAGTENGVAATKTYTATVIALAQMFGLIADEEYSADDYIKAWQKTIPDALSVDNTKVVQEILDHEHIFVFGDADTYGAACEVALKLKEVALTHAEAMLADEVKHGPICLTGPNFLNIFLTSHRSDDIIKNMKQIKARGGKIITLQSSHCASQKLYDDVSDYVITIPDTNRDTDEVFNMLSKVIFFQKVVHDVAIAKGLNPDRPKGLAKAVTV